MTHALVIIDMQPQFGDHVYDVVEPIMDLIDQAMQVNAPILVVEYEDSGETDERILKQLESYGFWNKATKPFDDGSSEIVKELGRMGCGDYEIHLCGINLAACVRRTADGLRGFDRQVTVLVDACSQPEEWDDPDFYHYDESCRDNVMIDLEENGIAVCLS